MTIRAFALSSFDAPPALLDDLPEPTPADGEVLVRVQASSVNAVDSAIVLGMLTGMLEHRFPIVLGRDYAGVVEQVGPEVTGYAPGDEVFGFVPHADPVVQKGSWTDLIAVPADDFIAHRPPGVDRAAAGAAPLAGITALLSVDALSLSAGDRVLIVGATGGVGSLAAQLAVHAGATVIAPGLPDDEGFLRSLGVSEIVDRNADIVTAVRDRHPEGVDAVLDLVSYAPDGFEVNATALGPGGRGASPLSAAGDAPGRTNIVAAEAPENLGRLGGLLDSGALRVPIQASHPLDRAGEALLALGHAHTQGKLAIEIA